MGIGYRVKTRSGKGKIVTHSHLYSSKNEANRVASGLQLRDHSKRTKAWSVKVVYKDKPPKTIKKTLSQRYPQKKPLPKPKPKSVWL